MDLPFYSRKILQIWNGWEIRILVLLSLLLQFILILFGSRRKYISKSWIWILVWSAYLIADWVATVALSNLAINQGYLEAKNSATQDPNNLLQALWAPFLLLHLGGPDTITAYSLEDNELWLRHLLGFVVQVAVALYVFMRSWSHNVLTFISIPIFICGIAKYGERTWVLWSSSAERFKDSLLSIPDPSAGLVKYILSDTTLTKQPEKHEHILAGHILFKKVAHFYAGLLLDSFEALMNPITFDRMLAEDVFSIIAVALGFMYDMLFTKNTIVYSHLGFSLRCVSFISSVTALIIFSTMININHYSLVDISITYVLLVGAVVLEFFSFILHFYSDWAKLCLTKFKKGNSVRTFLDSPRFNNKRWSESMGQFSLISYCLKQRSVRCFGLEKLIGFTKFSEKYMYSTCKDVSVDLVDLILTEFVEKLKRVIPFEGITVPERLAAMSPNMPQRLRLLYDFGTCRKVLALRGDSVFECYELGDDFLWCTVDVDFDHSLLIWHIATDLCYYNDFAAYHEDDHGYHNISSNRRNSKLLSDYLLYLLLLRPLMIPKGIGDLRFKGTCDETKEHLQQRAEKYEISNKISEEAEAEAYCKHLLEEVAIECERNYELSALSFGRKLAKQLKALESKNYWNCHRKWEMISKVWVEMLGYAAIHCEWREHCQQLKNGGELITHVALLMTHLGLNERSRSLALRSKLEHSAFALGGKLENGASSRHSRRTTNYRDLIDFVDRKEAEIKELLKRRDREPLLNINTSHSPISSPA